MISSWRHNHRRRSGHFNVKWLTRFGAALVFILVVFYIGLNNNIATQGYRLTTTQEEIRRLEEENTVMEIKVAAAQSLQRLESESSSFAFSALEHIEYLAAPTPAVAVR